MGSEVDKLDETVKSLLIQEKEVEDAYKESVTGMEQKITHQMWRIKEAIR